MIGIPSVATERASAEFVFTHFNTENEDGISSKPYIFLLGLLMSQYTLTGYDASAYMVYLFHSFPSFSFPRIYCPEKLLEFCSPIYKSFVIFSIIRFETKESSYNCYLEKNILGFPIT